MSTCGHVNQLLLLFIFQSPVCGEHTDNKGVYVYKNNQIIMYNWEWRDEGHGYLTNSVVFELMAGEEIYLVLLLGHFLFSDGNYFSTFSGSFLFPL